MKKINGAITELDGFIFGQCMYSGCSWMMEREKQLDDINVFPVPDSDTGTNMSATLRMVKSILEDIKEASISKVANVIAESSLMESRGNSGAILSQFLQGFAEAVSGKTTIDVTCFANAVMEASHQAYQAVSDPKEGTVLTVMREWSQYVHDLSQNIPYYSLLIPRSLQFAEKVLQNTKKQMQVLKNADVVDAGAQGFVYLLEGIVDYIQKGYTQRSTWKATETEFVHGTGTTEDKKYHYAMECLLSGSLINHSMLRDSLERVAGSCVIAGSKQKVRIILQTDRPDLVVQAMRPFGEIQQEKIDDIMQQNRDIYNEGSCAVALVTDTACDIPESWMEEFNIHKVPFRLTVGKETYLDEYTIRDEDFYDLLKKSGQTAKTSQPSQADFSRIYDWTTKYFEKTLSVHLSRSLSACEQASRQTSIRYPSESIHVIDSKNASVGIGFLMLYAARMIKNEVPWEMICHQIEKLRSQIRLYFMVNDINYLIKGGRLSAKKGMMAKMLNIKPILYLDESGAIVPKDKAIGIRLANKKLFNIVRESISSDKKYWIGIVHTNNLPLAEYYRDQMKAILNPEEIVVCQLSPTLGAHTGPNAIGISYIEFDQDDIDLIS